MAGWGFSLLLMPDPRTGYCSYLPGNSGYAAVNGAQPPACIQRDAQTCGDIICWPSIKARRLPDKAVICYSIATQKLMRSEQNLIY
ncbi:hypothetical protein LI328DRAFT_130150 [Trichoderma asperelloides]|nr:hypothetical protein LI328DRAFT_130150 [Trichoderma asperelloides]